MSDEIRPEDEVEAHGPFAEGPTAEGPRPRVPRRGDEDEPDVEAHGPVGMGPVGRAPVERSRRRGADGRVALGGRGLSRPGRCYRPGLSSCAERVGEVVEEA